MISAFEEGQGIVDRKALAALKKAVTRVLYLFLKNADDVQDDCSSLWGNFGQLDE